MRKTYALAVLLAVSFFAMPGTSAQAANYCLTEDVTICGFTSLEQCLTSLTGRGPGFCDVDPSQPGAPVRATSRKRQ